MSFNYWNFESLEKPQNFIFGFGSIVNDESRKSTDSSSGDPIPVRISSDFGYRRMWNFQGSSAKLTALGLVKVTNPAEKSTINGIIYPIKGNDMTAFDEREEGYNRVEVPLNLIQSVGWKQLPIHDYKIWAYIPQGVNGVAGQDLQPATKFYPILQTYIDVVLTGFLKYGENFAIEFLYTTGWWSKYWLNDRQVPRRPWIFQKKYKMVDNLLENYSQKYGMDTLISHGKQCKINLYKVRKLPVEFGVYFNEEIDNGTDSDKEIYCKYRNHPETLSEMCFECN